MEVHLVAELQVVQSEQAEERVTLMVVMLP